MNQSRAAEILTELARLSARRATLEAELAKVLATPTAPPAQPAAAPVEYLTTREAAAFLRTSTDTLERMRTTRAGPAWKRVGRRILYSRAELAAFGARGHSL